MDSRDSRGYPAQAALLLILSGPLAFACGPTYDDCHAHRNCAVSGGSGGDGGGRGGASGDAAGPGGSGGDRGDGTPRVGGPCSGDARACAGAAETSVLVCRAGIWARQACAASERCNSEAPGCAAIAAGCEERRPGEAFCEGNTRKVCGPDLLSTIDEACDGRCAAGGCLPERCGDRIVQEGEACDDGNEDDSDACVQCELARCGDGFLRDGEEQCDDGNGENDDDCVEGCTPARCGDGFVHTASEECDDGADNGDTRACTSACVAAQCGDGLVFEAAEECDDANDVATDGCGACAFAVTRLVAGEAFTCAVFGDGSLRCWGRNDSGQLGLGDREDRGDQPGELGANLPSVSFDHPVSDVALGARHACAISDGAVYCWGDGSSGALGQGNESMKTAPARVDIGPGTPAAVAVGEKFSCVMLEDGTVRCWGESAALGSGAAGPIGDEPDEMGENLKNATLSDFGVATQIAARRQHVCALLDTQRVACWGGGQSSPKQAKPLRVRSIAVGLDHWCVLNDQRDVQCWGAGSRGQLGNDEAVSRTDAELADVTLPRSGAVDGLASGDSFTCAIAEGKAYCWGEAGPQLGQPAHAEAGRNLGDESGEMSTMMPVALGPDAVVQSLAAGLDHVCALLTSGAVKCWGGNDAGQLGLGDTASRGYTVDEMGDALPDVSLR